MSDIDRKKRMKELLEQGLRFGYSIKPEQGLDDILAKTNQFKKVRLEAERSAMHEYKKENPTNESSFTFFEDKGMIEIWDLRDELAK
jgi:hypothetical protein